jgi:protein-S-isoprenylcysteine O-methyltransferase Ste14
MLRWCAAIMPMFWCSLIGQVGAGAPHFMQWVCVGSANAMVHRTTRAPEPSVGNATLAYAERVKLASTLAYSLAWPALFLWLGGDRLWFEGWIFAGWFGALCVVTVTWLYVKNPALLAERSRLPGTGGQRGWDVLVVVVIMLLFIAWLVGAPLDLRHGWTARLPRALEAVGAILLVPAAFFLFRALHDNTFASGVVRVQKDRKQQVVSTGVYGVVRHPMYLGALFMLVGMPLLVGSRAALGLAGLFAIVLAGRIVGEERLLARELDGYADYRRRVRWRLVPFIW